MTLLVATQDPNTPAETYVRQHMRLLAPGATVGVAFQDSGPPPVDIPFHTVGMGRGGLRGKLLTLARLGAHGYAGAPAGAQRAALHRFMRDHGVSVVLAEFGPTGAAMRSLCREMGIPLVVNFHGYDATVMPKSRLVRYAYSLLARDAQAIVGGSQHFRTHLIELGFAPDRVHVVPCGVELGGFGPGAARSGRRLVAVGRLTPKKAPDRTLQAIAIARQSVPDLTLDIIGDGPMRPRCEAEIDRLSLRDAVTLHGARDHAAVCRMLAQSDIFVQHSVVAPNGDTESQGISLVEAMASCLPVVVTEHNGFAETVEEGVTGYLVPEHDTTAMAARIVALLRDPDLRRSMGEAGRTRAETHFESGVVARRMRTLLGRFAHISAPESRSSPAGA